MWIESTEFCSECGSEVALATDGRYAYGYVTWRNGIADTDTDVVWRDGQALVFQCPVYTINGLCGNHVEFNGEGTGPMNEPYYAKPILESAP